MLSPHISLEYIQILFLHFPLAAIKSLTAPDNSSFLASAPSLKTKPSCYSVYVIMSQKQSKNKIKKERKNSDCYKWVLWEKPACDIIQMESEHMETCRIGAPVPHKYHVLPHDYHWLYSTLALHLVQLPFIISTNIYAT